jgi:hypothetical protein
MVKTMEMLFPVIKILYHKVTVVYNSAQLCDFSNNAGLAVYGCHSF